MPEPRVELCLRNDGSSGRDRLQAMAEISAIAARPVLDLERLRTTEFFPSVPGPPQRAELQTVKRAKPMRARNDIRSTFLTDATRELFERLGETERRVIEGAVVFRWDLGDNEGRDGIVVARKSGEETKGGETVGGQIATMMEYCESKGLRPRFVVAVLNLSGQMHFESRHDFAEVFDANYYGYASWVVYRNADRVARAMEWFALFVYHLRERDIKLHIAQLNTEFDPHDRAALMPLWIHAAAAELDWANTTTRLQAASVRQMLDAGKGWSNTGGFGFTRDEHNYVVVDEELWPIVLDIHNLYATLANIDAVQRAIKKKYRRKISRDLLEKILRDPRFRTGEFRTKDPRTPEGYRVDFVELDRPVPAAIWEHNQRQLSAVRGKQEKVPAGAAVLRGIPMYHAACMDSDGGNPDLGALQLRFGRDDKQIIRHFATEQGEDGKLHVPHRCRGYALRAAPVEALVMRTLRDLVTDDEMLRAAVARAATGADPESDGVVLTTNDRQRLHGYLDRLQRHADALWQEHLDKISNGKRLSRDALASELDHVNAEMEAIRGQLDMDERLRARPPRESEPPPEVLRLLSDEPPAEPDARLRRWELVRRLVSRIVIHDIEGGFRLELHGPLIPAEDAPNWDPTDALSEGSGDAARVPKAPNPFAFSAKRERFVQAFVVTASEVDREDSTAESLRASPMMTYGAVLEQIRILAARYPSGRLLNSTGPGQARWDKHAPGRGLAQAHSTAAFLTRECGGVAVAMREALGSRAAVLDERVAVTDREDALVVLEEMLRGGFRFDEGWRARLLGNRGTAVSYWRLRDFGRRFEGDPQKFDVLVREAAERCGVDPFPLAGIRPPTARDLVLAELTRCEAAPARVLAEATGRSKVQVNVVLRQLLGEGKIELTDPRETERRKRPWYQMVRPGSSLARKREPAGD